MLSYLKWLSIAGVWLPITGLAAWAYASGPIQTVVHLYACRLRLTLLFVQAYRSSVGVSVAGSA